MLRSQDTWRAVDLLKVSDPLQNYCPLLQSTFTEHEAATRLGTRAGIDAAECRRPHSPISHSYHCFRIMTGQKGHNAGPHMKLTIVQSPESPKSGCPTGTPLGGQGRAVGSKTTSLAACLKAALPDDLHVSGCSAAEGHVLGQSADEQMQQRSWGGMRDHTCKGGALRQETSRMLMISLQS